MNIEDLIKELQKYPPHYEVEALYERDHREDLTAEVVGVKIVSDEIKIVSLELGTQLLSDAEERRNGYHFANQVS